MSRFPALAWFSPPRAGTSSCSELARYSPSPVSTSPPVASSAPRWRRDVQLMPVSCRRQPHLRRWANYGNGYETIGFRKDRDALVHLRGGASSPELGVADDDLHASRRYRPS